MIKHTTATIGNRIYQIRLARPIASEGVYLEINGEADGLVRGRTYSFHVGGKIYLNATIETIFYERRANYVCTKVTFRNKKNKDPEPIDLLKQRLQAGI